MKKLGRSHVLLLQRIEVHGACGAPELDATLHELLDADEIVAIHVQT